MVYTYTVSRINIKIKLLSRYIILLLLLFDCNMCNIERVFFFVSFLIFFFVLETQALTRSNYTIVKLPACSENSFVKKTLYIGTVCTYIQRTLMRKKRIFYTQNISNSIRTPPLRINIHQCFALFKISDSCTVLHFIGLLI